MSEIEGASLSLSHPGRGAAHFRKLTRSSRLSWTRRTSLAASASSVRPSHTRTEVVLNGCPGLRVVTNPPRLKMRCVCVCVCVCLCVSNSIPQPREWMRESVTNTAPGGSYTTHTHTHTNTHTQGHAPVPWLHPALHQTLRELAGDSQHWRSVMNVLFNVQMDRTLGHTPRASLFL